MPVPIIAAGAAAVAARLAAKKLAQEAAKKAAKAATAKTAQIAKNSVKVKPAAKSVSNPPDRSKVLDKQLRRSFGSEGEERTGRKELIQIKKLASEKSPAKRPSNWGTGANRVMINSAKTTRVVKVNPKKK